MSNLFPESVDLVDFHTKFGLDVNEKPVRPSTSVITLRRNLIEEEMHETMDALDELIEAVDDPEAKLIALANIADGIVDSIYVLIGTAVSLGIDLGPVWAAVHQANMAKVGGATREDGKILKPEGWTPPNIVELIARQRG